MNQIKLDHNDGKTCFDLDQKALVGRLHQHQMSDTSQSSLHGSSRFPNGFNPIEYFRKTMGVKNLSETKQSLAFEEKKDEQSMESIFSPNKISQEKKQIKTYFDENRLSKLKVTINKDCGIKKVKHLVKDNKNTKRSDKKKIA